jgi:hypothetical protein
MYKKLKFEQNISHLNNNLPFLLDIRLDKLEDINSKRVFYYINTEKRNQNTFNLKSMISKLNFLKSVQLGFYQKIERSFSTIPKR